MHRQHSNENKEQENERFYMDFEIKLFLGTAPWLPLPNNFISNIFEYTSKKSMKSKRL